VKSKSVLDNFFLLAGKQSDLKGSFITALDKHDKTVSTDKDVLSPNSSMILEEVTEFDSQPISNSLMNSRPGVKPKLIRQPESFVTALSHLSWNEDKS